MLKAWASMRELQPRTGVVDPPKGGATASVTSTVRKKRSNGTKADDPDAKLYRKGRTAREQAV